MFIFTCFIAILVVGLKKNSLKYCHSFCNDISFSKLNIHCTAMFVTKYMGFNTVVAFDCFEVKWSHIYYYIKSCFFQLILIKYFEKSSFLPIILIVLTCFGIQTWFSSVWFFSVSGGQMSNHHQLLLYWIEQAMALINTFEDVMNCYFLTFFKFQRAVMVFLYEVFRFIRGTFN